MLYVFLADTWRCLMLHAQGTNAHIIMGGETNTLLCDCVISPQHGKHWHHIQVLAHKPSACSFAHGQLIAWRKMHSVFMSPQQSSLIFLATKEGVQSIMCVVVVIHTSQQSQRQQSILAVAIMQGLEHTCRSMNTQYFHISQLWRLLVLLRLTL